VEYFSKLFFYPEKKNNINNSNLYGVQKASSTLKFHPTLHPQDLLTFRKKI